MQPVRVIGGGLAGSEAAWQLARRGVPVTLYEMRPRRRTPAHQTDRLAELVCSNSLKSIQLDNASGVLNAELERLGSLILRCGRESALPAGKALAVDREEFAGRVTQAIEAEPRIDVVREEVTRIPEDEIVIVASGPLTSEALAQALTLLTGQERLHFFDAIAPTLLADSLNEGRIFRASRYGAGQDYLNCPLNEEEYRAFWEALVEAEVHVPHNPEDEDIPYFEACLPVEVIARRGFQTLLYGPMKPVGLPDPRSGDTPFAVVQLRQENRSGELWGMVGFQTQLKRGEQKRVLQMIPGLEEAEFARYGALHRNTYLNAPALLESTLQLRSQPRLLFAGQLIGVEGYVESAAAGLLAGINAARLARGEQPVIPPEATMLGALMRYVSDPWVKSFQPMNANFGLLPRPAQRIRERRARYRVMAQRAMEEMDRFALEVNADEA